MKIQYRKSDVDRCLMDWSRNMRAGYGDHLGARSYDFSDRVFGSKSPFTEDYSYEEKLCLNEMMKLHEHEPELHLVGSLEYISRGEWMGDCRVRKGWLGIDGQFRSVKGTPRATDFMAFLYNVYGVSKNQYYTRLRKLQDRIYENVVMIG